MRFFNLSFLLVAMLSTAFGGESNQDKDASKTDADAVEKWLSQLNATEYQQREEAIRGLISVGPSAIAPLERLADDLNADPDVRLRAARAAFAIGAIKIELVRTLGGPNDRDPSWSRRVALSPDGKYAVTVGGQAIRYWDLAAGKLIRTFGENNNGFWSVVFSPDGKSIIAGGNKIYIFDVNTGKLSASLSGHTRDAWGIARSLDGSRVFSGAWDQSIRVWDVKTGQAARVFKNVRGMVRCLALSPDGKLLASGHFNADGGPGTIRLWDVEKGEEIRSMAGHQMEVTSISFSSDGKHLLTSGFDKTVRLWNVADGKEIKRFQGGMNRVECAVYTPDGRRILTCGDETDPYLRMWEVSSGKLLSESERVEQGLLAVAALPDGRQCLTTGKDGTVRLWRWSR
jgi:WD40 repeat protein